MSLGYLGRCHLELADGETYIYSYTGENWNLPKDEAKSLEAIEGSFTIRASALEEPEVHTKRVRKPNGRKVVEEKVITHIPDLMGHVNDGGIVVDALCGVDEKERSEGTACVLPRIIRQLLYRLYETYQLEGSLPESASFIQ